MNTYFITYFTLFSMILPTYASFGFPDNVNFHTEIYNTSNCSLKPIKNYTLQHMCFKTNIVEEYPECCNDLFNDINVFPNSSLGECIQTNMTYTNRLAVRYNCNLTNFKELNTEETFSYIGIIMSFVLIISIIITCSWFSFCRNRKSYNKI